MKKYAFLALLVCGLMASLFVGNSVSQEADDSDPALTITTVDEDVAGEAPLELLRGKLLEITQKRVQTMTEDELKDELVRMQKKLAAYNANEKLKQAQQILNDLVKEFPETPAAAQASQMLNVQVDAFSASAFDDPDDGFRIKKITPIPDPSFEKNRKK